ncbi:hypothetical protein RJT34_18983 [Clitoria ternatea]|uniref:phosphatidate phosphatase n=1 Tax=Clitoria ternatea TaxID=43366 RepID=A0AAN9P3Q7_CLITE
MNVVGKVGSLITQGVYSVATPFHPFGGAVDVIVVQQQDGTFRSTPWYVRFGKFQGVLKGAEKVVRINVNGVEANFHMYLDNSGEAYFVKEVEDDVKGIKPNKAAEAANSSVYGQEYGGGEIDKKNGGYLSLDDAHGYRLGHSVSDSGVFRFKDEGRSSISPLLQKAESDVDRRFYEFQDDQSSFDGSVEVSEYESSRYENLDVENLLDSQGQGSHPEVVLVSVDGHVLTAPISELEQNEENLQLKTPQFHLGPGEGTEFYEGSGEFCSDENAWAADYVSQLDVSTANVPSGGYNATNGDNASGLLLDVRREEVNVSHTEQTLVIKNQEDLHLQADSEEAVSGMRRGTLFKSCLELHEFAKLAGNADLQDVGSSLEVHYSVEESNVNCSTVERNEQENINQSGNIEESSPLDGHTSPESEIEIKEVDKDASVENGTGSGSHSGNKDIECTDEHVDESVSNDYVDDSQQTSALEDACSKSETAESETQIATSNEEDHSHSGLGFEVSLCGHELKVGMGLIAAAEAFEAHRVSAEEFRSSAPSVIKNENLVVKFQDRYLLWEKAAPLVLGKAVFGLDLPVEPKDTIPVVQDDAVKPGDDGPGPASSGRRWRLWPIPFRRVKTIEHTSSDASTEDVFLDSESDLLSSVVEPSPTSARHESPRKQFVRTNVPSSEMIASLNLKDGQNLVTFNFSTRVLGTQQVDAHIYLWKWNARIVISDVDGTITKSDVLGQFMPLVGKDWTQSGVARLFSAIKENGYQLLFLSARAIVQAYLTRSFLVNLKQDGKTLPNGPVVISPDGLFPSLYREVIRRAPHEFKIACLEDIRRLFPSDYNPFYAGFGNRDTDELSYRKMGIPKGKIFIINPKGEVATSHRVESKSYTSLHTLVNDMFPPTSLVEQEDFNSWNYWRMPFPDVD